MAKEGRTPTDGLVVVMDKDLMICGQGGEQQKSIMVEWKRIVWP